MSTCLLRMRSLSRYARPFVPTSKRVRVHAGSALTEHDYSGPRIGLTEVCGERMPGLALDGGIRMSAFTTSGCEVAVPLQLVVIGADGKQRHLRRSAEHRCEELADQVGGLGHDHTDRRRVSRRLLAHRPGGRLRGSSDSAGGSPAAFSWRLSTGGHTFNRTTRAIEIGAVMGGIRKRVLEDVEGTFVLVDVDAKRCASAPIANRDRKSIIELTPQQPNLSAAGLAAVELPYTSEGFRGHRASISGAPGAAIPTRCVRRNGQTRSRARGFPQPRALPSGMRT